MNTSELKNVPKKVIKHSTLRPDEFLTTDELMSLLKIGHKQTIYKLIRQGMPAILVGKNYRFLKHEVIAFLKDETRKKRRKS